jgi:hypothetical protein
MTAQVIPLFRGQSPASGFRLRAGGEPVFSPGELRQVLSMVFADAIARREPLVCDDCLAAEDGICPPHAADLDRCDEYQVLAAQLGIEIGGEDL